MVFSLDVRAHSETGLVRKNNQDSGYASPTMLMVADGMGGAAAGDLASSVAIREILRSDGHHSPDTAPEVLAGALARANHLLADLVAADPTLDGMGTTVCGALFTGNELSLVHLGDSRGYLLRGGVLHRITHDHSWVQSLVDEGKITLAEAAVHPHRSLLLKVLNGQPTHEPDLDTVELELDDRVLFCSDGLCGFVSDQTIRHIIANTPSLDVAMDKLVAAAHAGGGADNITVLLADVLPHSEALDARPPVIVGAAVDATVPDTQENTLHGLAPVPGVGALTLSPEPVAPQERVVDDAMFPELDEETSRYAPKAPRRHPVLAVAAMTLALALVGAAGLWGVWRYSRTQFYVGEQAEQVAVFQGFPGTLLGRPMSTVVETPGIAVADLPGYFRQQVHATIPVTSRAAAETTVAQLRSKAQQCIARRGHPVPTRTSPAATAPATGPSVTPPATTPPPTGGTTLPPTGGITPGPGALSASPSLPSGAATPSTTGTASAAGTGLPSSSPLDQEC